MNTTTTTPTAPLQTVVFRGDFYVRLPIPAEESVHPETGERVTNAALLAPPEVLDAEGNFTPEGDLAVSLGLVKLLATGNGEIRHNGRKIADESELRPAVEVAA
jgi:hypothetical protein